MRINPYLEFGGDCEAAFRFYERSLGGEIEAMLPFAGSPAEDFAPKEWGEKIMHARLAIGDQVLMGSDTPPDRRQTPAGFSVSLQMESAEAADRVFHALAEGGTVRMPIEETFWAIRFGMLTDRFGIPWMVNCDREDG